MVPDPHGLIEWIGPFLLAGIDRLRFPVSHGVMDRRVFVRGDGSLRFPSASYVNGWARFCWRGWIAEVPGFSWVVDRRVLC